MSGQNLKSGQNKKHHFGHFREQDWRVVKMRHDCANAWAKYMKSVVVFSHGQNGRKPMILPTRGQNASGQNYSTHKFRSETAWNRHDFAHGAILPTLKKTSLLWPHGQLYFSILPSRWILPMYSRGGAADRAGCYRCCCRYMLFYDYIYIYEYIYRY